MGDRAAIRSSSVPAPLRGHEPLKHVESATDDGRESVSLYVGGAVLVRIQGVVRKGAENNRITRHLADFMRDSAGPLHLFVDLKGFTHYDSEVRIRYTEAIRQHEEKVSRIWVFADARVVRMGVSVAALALRQIRLVERSEFDKELRNALG